MAALLTGIAIALQRGFEANDLNVAIAATQEAINLSPHNDTELLNRLNTLELHIYIPSRNKNLWTISKQPSGSGTPDHPYRASFFPSQRCTNTNWFQRMVTKQDLEQVVAGSTRRQSEFLKQLLSKPTFLGHAFQACVNINKRI